MISWMWKSSVARPLRCLSVGTLLLAASAHAETTGSSSPGMVLRLVPPRPQPVEGEVRIQALVTSERVARVAFFLDGEAAGVGRQRPFEAKLRFASPSRPQTLKALAFDARGLPLGEEVLEVNRRLVPFRLELFLEGDLQAGELRAVAEPQVPPEGRLAQVELYRNEERLAALSAAPFETAVPVEEAGPADYVRAVAHLEDGSSIDAVRLLAARGTAERVDVRTVELFAVVTDGKGRPVEGLAREDFRLRRGKQEVPLRSLAYAADVPLHLGVAVDSSGSMFMIADAARPAAARFLRDTLGARDRAFLVDFAVVPRLLQGSTAELEALMASLHTIEAGGSTALYDALLFSLLQFDGPSERRALIVLTDGEDMGSGSTARECARYGEALGVPIYPVLIQTFGLLPPGVEVELRRLAAATGGRFHLVTTVPDLLAAYDSIQAELRSQYTLTFTTDHDLSEEELGSLELETRERRTQVRMAMSRNGAS